MELGINQQQCTFQVEVTESSFNDQDSKVEKLIQLLGNMVSDKSSYTVDHSNRVRDLSMLLAQRIEFPSDQLKSLEYAAILHDIGKIAIGKYLINKPSGLTQVEESMMQQHTMWGHKLIQPLLPDPLICDVVLYHHENYDGSGYPARLKGEDIPLAARIVRITDSYDAMTSVRPYRSPYSRKQAIELLKEDCRYFDPVLLKEFLTMIVTSYHQQESVATRGVLCCMSAEQ